MQASGDDIDLSGLMRAVARGLPKLIGAAALAAGAVYGALCLVPPSYKSTAQIILETPSSRLLRPGAVSGAPVDQKIDENEVASQVEVIRSRDLLAEVVAAQRLDQAPQFNPALKPATLVNRVLGLFSGAVPGADGAERALYVLEQNVKVAEAPKTRLINIDATAQDPKLAADLANAIAEAYLRRNRSSQVQDANAATTSLGASMADVKQQAETAEAEFERFRASSGLLEGQNNLTLNNQQLSELNTQLTQATAARTEAEARARILKDMIQSGNVEQSQDVLKSPNMQQLFQQKLRIERDIAELSATLLPGHPRMKELQSELATADDRLKTEAKQAALGIADDVKVAAAREDALKASIGTLTENALKLSDAQAKLSSLEREAQSKRSAYDSLLQRMNEASSVSTDTAVSAMADLNERAVPASVPDSPKKGQMSLFAGLGAFILGLVGMIGRGLMGGGKAVEAPIAEKPAAKSVPAPMAAAEPFRARNLAALSKHLTEGEAAGRSARILLVAPEDAGSASRLARDLAARLAASGAGSVVIDAGDGVSPGLAELLRGEADFEAVLMVDGDGRQSLAGGADLAQALTAHAEAAGAVIEALEATYQHVVIGAEPEAARRLLEALGGAVDVGVICAPGGAKARSPFGDGFLGYDVDGLRLVWLESPASAPRGVFGRQRVQRSAPAHA